MERVYESYVAAQMRKYFGPDGWKVSEQDRGYYLFDELKGENNTKSIFRIRPDIVMRREGQIVVMDTKWKRLVPERSKNYGITQADMYQMYAYGKKYATDEFQPEVWLLYPKTMDMSEPLLFKSDDGIIVHAYFVDIPNIEESMNSLKCMIQDSFALLCE
jgi:5-methylcytosine-specific restriction enzyme subunit McrC